MPLLSPRWAAATTVAVSLLFGLSSCASFGESADLELLDNSCRSDLQCGSGERCASGLCVQRSADEQNVLLQIIPEFMPDGSDSLPLYTELARIDGTTTRNVELRLSVPVQMRLRRDGQDIPGEVRITPSSSLTGISARSLTLANDTGLRQSVTLPEEGSYVVRGIPTDRSLPPVETLITAQKDLQLDLAVDSASTRTYLFDGLPTEAAMQVQARLSVGGPRISSVAAIVDGQATLDFATDAQDFLLEVTPLESNTPQCDSPGSVVPSFRVQTAQLVQDDDGHYPVTLPSFPPSIDYAGHVVLCEETSTAPESLESLTITLRSTELMYDASTAQGAATAYFQGDNRIAYNDNTGLLQFCAPALPGTYEVIVNAPPTLGTCVKVQDEVRCGCGIFSEERLIQAPPGSTAQRGASLQLPTMASLSGSLATGEGTAVMGATIEAVALGVSAGIELAAEDRGLTAYNRSRQATSDTLGTFRLPLDVGAYDVTIKPPAESGFAWTVVRDVLIGNRNEEFVQQFSLSAPVSIKGTLGYRDGSDAENESLAGAVIRAYRVVTTDDRLDKRRTIALGQAIADENGRFTLLLPADIRSGWF